VNPGHPSHIELTNRLEKVTTELTASEAQGIAAGLLAAGANAAERLIAEAIPETSQGDVLAEECRTVLESLFDETDSGLSDPGFGFELLLPIDTVPLSERAGALRDWCNGFLLGFAMAETAPSQLPPEVSEALQDIGELARLDPSSVGATEEEEASYAELVEFLRMAAILIHEELAKSPRKAS